MAVEGAHERWHLLPGKRWSVLHGRDRARRGKEFRQQAPPSRWIVAFAPAMSRCVGKHGLDTSPEPGRGLRRSCPDRPEHAEDVLDRYLGDRQLGERRVCVLRQGRLPLRAVFRVSPARLPGCEHRLCGCLEGSLLARRDGCLFGCPASLPDRVEALRYGSPCLACRLSRRLERDLGVAAEAHVALLAVQSEAKHPGRTAIHADMKMQAIPVGVPPGLVASRGGQCFDLSGGQAVRHRGPSFVGLGRGQHTPRRFSIPTLVPTKGAASARTAMDVNGRGKE